METGLSFAGVPTEELFEMAAMVEQSGFDFYARLTSRSADPRARNELRYLRDDEALHKSWFLAQLRAAGARPCGNLSDRLQADVDRDFSRPVEDIFVSGAAADLDAVLRLGSELARKTIDLYTALRGIIPSGQQAELGMIISAEESHLLKLDHLRATADRNATPAY